MSEKWPFADGRKDKEEVMKAANSARKAQAEEHKNRGNEYFKKKDYTMALKSYNKAIDLDPSNAMFYSNRSGAHASLGQWASAESDARLLTKMLPKFAKGWGRLGTALMGMKKYEEAVEPFQKAAELDPENAEYKKQLVECRRQASVGAGVAGERTRAVFYIEKYKKQGVDEFKKGNFVSSARYFTQAIELDPRNEILLSNRSGSYCKFASLPSTPTEKVKEYYNKALEDAEKCIRLKPEWPKGYSRKGAALHGLKRLEDAAATYRAGLQVDDKYQPCIDGLAAVEKEISEIVEDEQEWEEKKEENKKKDEFVSENPEACAIPDLKLPSVFCWKCGEEGHFPSNCTKRLPMGIVGGNHAYGYDQCKYCGGFGHLKQNCPEKRRKEAAKRWRPEDEDDANPTSPPEPSTSSGGGGMGTQCYRCGQNGHFSRDCPYAGKPSERKKLFRESVQERTWSNAYVYRPPSSSSS